MARQRTGMMEVPIVTEDGEVKMARLAHRADNRVPLKDEKNNLVPQFVNVTSKTQIMTIQGNPGNPIKVPPFGILEGAQWRDTFATPGNHFMKPPFRERLREKSGEFDKKYLLTEEQVLEEIKFLSALKPRKGEPADPDIIKNKVKRIEALLSHGVITKSGDRAMDDRESVGSAAHKSIYGLNRAADEAVAKAEAAMEQTG